MIGIVGYNFCGDINALDPYPSNIGALTQVEI